MSENLMATNQKIEPAHGFGNKVQVEQHQQAIQNMLGTDTVSLQTRLDILEQARERLNELRIRLDNERLAFMSLLQTEFNISSYNDLNKKIQEWYNKGPNGLLTLNDNLYRSIVDALKQENLNTKEILEIATGTPNFDKILEDFASLGGKHIKNTEKAKKGQQIIGDSLKHGRNMGKLVKLFSGRITVKANDKKIDKKKKNYIIEVNSEGLTYNEKKRMLSVINDVADNESEINLKLTLSPEAKRIIANAILSSKNISYNQAVKEELEQNFVQGNNYAFNKSYQSIKGFLGEVYWNAFWRNLTGKSGNKLKTLPVGDIKNFDGDSLPIDILVNGYGMQIKSYKTWSGKFSDAMVNLGKSDLTLGGFFDRAKIPNDIQQPFANFYFSRAYNKPIEQADEDYRTIFSHFDEILSNESTNKGLAKIAQPYIPNLLKIDEQYDVFKENIGDQFYDSLFEYTKGDRRNRPVVAFLVNDKLFFTSKIIEDIISLLNPAEVQIQKKLVTSLQVYLTKDAIKSSSNLEASATWPENVASPKEEGMNLINNSAFTRVAYSVNFDVSHIINQYINSSIAVN